MSREENGKGALVRSYKAPLEPAQTRRPPRENLPSRGLPLDRGVRESMEARFGHDFRQVRVHADRDGATQTLHHGVRAFTSGDDILFAPGRYAPHTAEGTALLAHELAHVVQQRRTGGPPGAEHEAEAWRAARAVVRGTSPTVLLGSTPGAVQHADPPGKDPLKAVIDDPSLPTGEFGGQPGELSAIGKAGERHHFVETEAALKREGYTEIYFMGNFKGWVKKAFPHKKQGPEVVAIHPDRRRILVEDFTAGPWSTAEMKSGDPRRLPQDVPASPRAEPPTQKIAHLEKTVDYGHQVARNLPSELKDYEVVARDRYWRTDKPKLSVEVKIKPLGPVRPPGPTGAGLGGKPSIKPGGTPGLGLVGPKAPEPPTGVRAGAGARAAGLGVRLLAAAAEMIILFAVQLAVEWLKGKIEQALMERDMEAHRAKIEAQLQSLDSKITSLRTSSDVYARITMDVQYKSTMGIASEGGAVGAYYAVNYERTTFLGIDVSGRREPTVTAAPTDEDLSRNTVREHNVISYSVLIDDAFSKGRAVAQQERARELARMQRARRPSPSEQPSAPDPALLAPPGTKSQNKAFTPLPGAPGQSPYDHAMALVARARTATDALRTRGEELERRVHSNSPPTPAERASFLDDEKEWRLTITYLWEHYKDNPPDVARGAFDELLHSDKYGGRLAQIRIHFGGPSAPGGSV
ncbi:DUF4157 domain-containing protein [Actinomadura sp. 3N508]|uniref:DUF4157 domain-containing protein n=1 Tax=Actinomadura sp. 3N508 TaxID=3375153 RepID=UPI0037BC707E